MRRIGHRRQPAKQRMRFCRVVKINIPHALGIAQHESAIVAPGYYISEDFALNLREFREQREVRIAAANQKLLIECVRGNFIHPAQSARNFFQPASMPRSPLWKIDRNTSLLYLPRSQPFFFPRRYSSFRGERPHSTEFKNFVRIFLPSQSKGIDSKVAT
jgi:hypothetical protein